MTTALLISAATLPVELPLIILLLGEPDSMYAASYPKIILLLPPFILVPALCPSITFRSPVVLLEPA